MIIAISHQKGGVGKSTIAWNLAIALQNKYNVELVDLDIQKTLTYTNEIRRNETTLRPLTIRTFDNDFDLKTYIDNDRDDVVSIFDLGGFDSTINRIAIITADLVITPVSDRNFELLGLKSFEAILSQLNEHISGELTVKVLLNNINPQKAKLEELKNFIVKSRHFELLDVILRSRVDYDRSVRVGQSVFEYKNDSKASIEIKELTHEIEKILKLHQKDI